MAPDRQAPAIALRGVSFAYDGRPVLQDVSFEVGIGDFAALVGPNGGGKSTLLKLILGLLRPLAGEVRVFGQPPRRVSHRIGYVPQSFTYDPRFPVTVGDVVRMGSLGKHALQSSPGSVADALDRVGLPGLTRRPFHDLSGGQRQRVLIARALISGTEMLLLDEPTANIDQRGEMEVQEVLQGLQDTVTVVLVTHDLSFVSGRVDTVVCVNRRVTVHPTIGIEDVTGDVLRGMYGADARVVRHDLTCATGDDDH